VEYQWRKDGLSIADVLRVRGFAGGSVYERRLEVPLWLQVKEMRHDAATGQTSLAGIAPPGTRVAWESSGDLKEGFLGDIGRLRLITQHASTRGIDHVRMIADDSGHSTSVSLLGDEVEHRAAAFGTSSRGLTDN
jgi:hypothetical protein